MQPRTPAEQPGEEPERFLWASGTVRARDLRDGDVVRHDGQWRVVMDVFHDDDLASAELMFSEEIAPKQNAVIIEHLTGTGVYVVVRVVIEQPGEHELFSMTTVVPLRAFDLVTVQTPRETFPVPPRAPLDT